MIRRSGATENESQHLAVVFPVLWVPAHLFHLAIQDFRGTAPWTEAVVAIAALALILRPQSVLLLMLLAGSQIVDWVSTAPFAPDHWTLVAIVNLILILASVVGRGRGHPVVLAASPIRVALLIAYGAAALAKWNTGFLDPAASCAVAIGSAATLTLSDAIPGSWVPLIGLGVVTETVVFLGLLRSATCPWAVRLGLIFHGLLSLSPTIAVWDFTAILIALYIVFLPEAQLGAAIDRFRLARTGSPVADAVTRLRYPLVGSVGFYVVWINEDRFELLGPVGAVTPWVPFLPFLFLCLSLFLPGPVSSPPRAASSPDGGWRVGLVAAPVLVALVFVAASPYLGFRTTGAFTMFSNLSTEVDGGNHLLMRGWGLAEYQTDLVNLESSNDPVFQASIEAGQAETASTMRTKWLINPDAVAIVLRDDGSRVMWTAGNSAELFGSPGWFERWFLSFRSVTTSGQPRCGN